MFKSFAYRVSGVVQRTRLRVEGLRLGSFSTRQPVLGEFLESGGGGIPLQRTPSQRPSSSHWFLKKGPGPEATSLNPIVPLK